MSKYVNGKFTDIQFYKSCIEEGLVQCDHPLIRKRIRELRESIKHYYENHPDPLAKPMTGNCWRTIASEDGESGYDFRISKEALDWEDLEIEETMEDQVGCSPINSPYDCTGRRFTAWTHFSRTPAGVVMIHHWGLDV